ncbi:hypothetical protein H4Q26_012053 [Puccinia striiformis f. sp. tritici PST-130]|nr:hypothetical protein H4Q26_012053 [Puccinia striiformis f. sp. tritici PST-130]
MIINLDGYNYTVGDSTYKTNNLTYEDDANYLWAVNDLKKYIWRPQRIPKVFITD